MDFIKFYYVFVLAIPTLIPAKGYVSDISCTVRNVSEVFLINCFAPLVSYFPNCFFKVPSLLHGPNGFIDLKADQVIVKNITNNNYNVTCQLSINVTNARIHFYIVTIYPDKPDEKGKYAKALALPLISYTPTFELIETRPTKWTNLNAADDTTISTRNTNVNASFEIMIKEGINNLHFFIATVVLAVVAVALTVSMTVACYRYYSTVKRRTKNNYDELDIRLNERAFYHTPKLKDPVQTPSNSGARPRDAINQSLRSSSSPRQPMETDANPYSEIRDPYNN